MLTNFITNQKYKALIKVNVKNNINNNIIKRCMIVCVCFPSKEHTVNTFIFVIRIIEWKEGDTKIVCSNDRYFEKDLPNTEFHIFLSLL